MLHVAVIGSGPAGYYCAEGLQQSLGDEVAVDLIDRLPVPYGLIRFGVAPDHQSIKAVSRRYEKVALSPHIRFVGNVAVGTDIAVAELQHLYDAVVVATGAPRDRPLDIPGSSLPGVIGSAAFVGWYNGHPEFQDIDPPLDGNTAVVIGNGNVALDVARILSKSRREFDGSDIVDHALDRLMASRLRTIRIVGRRGPHQIAMTSKELGELGRLELAAPIVDAADFPPLESDSALETGQRKSLAHLREFASRPIDQDRKRIRFDFFAQPLAIEGDGSVERIRLGRTRLDDEGNARPTGETFDVPCGLIVSCIGYRSAPIDGLPYDEPLGRFVNENGVIAPGVYCVGWARRGPTGTIGTNRPDGFEVAEHIAAHASGGSGKSGGQGLDALLAARGKEVVSFSDWRRIEETEVARARPGAPREKMTIVADMLRTAHPE